MMYQSNSRRQLIAQMAGLLASLGLVRQATAAVPTPRAAEGPFYPTPTMRTPDVDNDLVKIDGRVEEAGGEIVILRGRITDRNMHPLAAHRIEIWQCDVNGKYLHSGDSRKVTYDQAFQGFGHDITDEAGNYVFRTIKPTVYPGRTPHIHVKVCKGEQELLTTQFYIKNHPNNARDRLFNRMSDLQANAVSMDFVDVDGRAEATINVIV